MTGTRARQVFYAVSAAVGLVLTWYFNLSYAGTDFFVFAWFANSASSSAAVDLIVLSVVLSVYMVVEGRRVGIRRAWLFIPLGFVVAMAFAVPAFLLLRERRLAPRGR